MEEEIDINNLEQLEKVNFEEYNEEGQKLKKGRGRPKGSKDKQPRKTEGYHKRYNKVSEWTKEVTQERATFVIYHLTQ